MAEHCAYGELHDEMIRDRIVVGLRDASIAQRLQMDPDLMLEKAMTLARQNEAVMTQQLIVRPPAMMTLFPLRQSRAAARHTTRSLKRAQVCKGRTYTAAQDVRSLHPSQKQMPSKRQCL